MPPIGAKEKEIVTPEPRLEIPTHDRRHISWIRDGKQSAEIFCRDPKRREELGLPPILVLVD